MVLATTLLILLTDARGGVTAAGQIARHSSHTPTPIHATSTQTANQAFLLYTDRPGGYHIQYPATWTYTHASPGTQFTDDANTPSYEVQVLALMDTSSVDLHGADPDNPTSWANYTLAALAERWQNEFSVARNDTSTVTFGQTAWQAGSGRIAAGDTHIRVDVFATVHNDRPYIISLLAEDDRFSSANDSYFVPMLHSFEFLPTPA